VEEKNKNEIGEKTIEQFALILVALIDEIHTPKDKDSKSYFEEIKN